MPAAVLWVLATLAYANSFRAGLIYDNYFILRHDARIQKTTVENVQLILAKDYWYRNSLTSLYRPAVTLSYLFNYAVLGNGEAPAGYHAINLAWHLANVALVYLLGWLVLAEFWPAFIMAAVWAVHPVLTESVTNVVGRADLMAAFGVLAGLLCYARSLNSAARPRMLWQLGVLAASAIGIFSKESGIVILAAMFLYDVACRPSAAPRARLTGYLAAAIPIAVFLAVRAQVLKALPEVPVPFTDNPLVGADFLTSRFTAVKVLGRYLWLLVWPAHLSCDYSFNQIPLVSWGFRSWADWQAVAALAVFAAVAALAVWSYRRQRPLFFFIAFFFAAIAPTANIFLPIGTIMAERELYLPAVAFAGCIAWAGWKLYQRIQPRWLPARQAAPAVLAIVCLALCARTFARNFDWYGEEQLWTSAAQVSPASYRVHEQLANWFATLPKKDLDAADREAARSVAILDPLPDEERPALPYADAGFCYRLTGDTWGTDGGAEWYRKALAVLLAGKKADAAFEGEFTRLNSQAGKIVPPVHVWKLYFELARTWRGLGRYQDAMDALNSVAWTDPRAELFEELSKTWRAMGDTQQAAISLLEGIAMTVPDQARLAADVVSLYRQTAAGTCALGAGGSVDFGCPLVHGQLCLASRNAAIRYRSLRRDNDAAGMAAAAVRSLGCPADMFR